MAEDAKAKKSKQTLGKSPTRARPTIQDIADKLGVSRALVSIALRGADGASAATRERVIKAAKEIGYYPDQSAALLRRRKSGQIGVLFTMRQPFEVDLVDALYRQASLKGYHLVLSSLGFGRSQKAALDELMRQRIEALIVLTSEGGAGTIKDLPEGIPIVTLGGPTTTQRKVDDVRVKNDMGIRQAVDHLVDFGHKRIAYIGPVEGPNAQKRIRGYQDAMAKHGLSKFVEIVESEFSETGGYKSAVELLKNKTRPTALVCGNDRCAVGVLSTLVRNGISVPGEMSIVGFDDSSVSKLPYVDLTSVHPDPESMAAMAIAAADTRISNPDHKVWKYLVPTSLAVRGSSAAPGAK